MRLLFSLPYWVYFILSAFAVLLAYQMYTFQAKDIAEVAAFLASDRARYMSGAVVDVNGGLL